MVRPETGPEGVEPGERCNRDGCKGTMMLPVAEGCSCHINPPCGACLDVRPICTVCEAEVE